MLTNKSGCASDESFHKSTIVKFIKNRKLLFIVNNIVSKDIYLIKMHFLAKIVTKIDVFLYNEGQNNNCRPTQG